MKQDFTVSDVSFEEIKGKVLVAWKGEKGGEELELIFDDGERFVLCHYQDCCEQVWLEDIIGDLDDLIGQEILLAEERTENRRDDKWSDSTTFTFYELRCRKASVTLRWVGESNGYYSEEVSVVKYTPYSFITNINSKGGRMNIMNNVMLDFETLDTSPDAAIISIGAVFFNEKSLGETFYTVIEINDAVKHGSVSDYTMDWWKRQSPDARKVLTEGTNTTHEALSQFIEFLSKGSGGCISNVRIWGCGAAFDNVIVREQFKKAGMDYKIQFWNDRCYRTIKAVFPDVTLARSGTHHNALDDAIFQAKHLMAIANKHKFMLQ